MTLAFRLESVRKSYPLAGADIEVLHGVSLDIAQGEFVSIMGPSGSGKSTLMHLLGALDTPSAGSVSVLDRDITTLDDDALARVRCRHIGFVFQSFHLLGSYDAAANVALAMSYSGRKDRWRRSQKLLEGLGLGARLHHRPAALSGGEKQRVAIARALANDPAILLADEPTGALDQKNGQAILDIFQSLNRQGRTIVLVTHDRAIAERATRIVEIVDGVIRSDQRTGRA